MKLAFVVLLSAVVFVSGCAGIPNIFGSDVISVQTRSIEEGTKDILVVKNILTIPNSPVLPDQEVVLSFVIQNKDKLREAKNVRVDLFNAPGFRNSAGVNCNSGANACLSQNDDGLDVCTLKNPCTIMPGEERPIQFKLRAPTKSQIANIKTQVNLDFKVLYDYDSSISFVIPAVNKEEVLRRQREGQKLDMIFDKAFSSGPLRVDVEPLGANFILDDYETVLLFTVKNSGSGTVVGSAIGKASPFETAGGQIPVTGAVTGLPVTGAAAAGQTDDSECKAEKGTCIDLTQADCDGYLMRDVCVNYPVNVKCCIPDPATTTCSGCIRYENLYWCYNSEGYGYCVAGGSTCLSGYQATADCSYESGGQPGQSSAPTQPAAQQTAVQARTQLGRQGIEITFPPQIDVNDAKLSGNIFTSQVNAAGEKVYRNTKQEIQLFRDRTQTSMSFSLRLSPDTVRDFRENNVPFRSYNIKATIYYTYELRNSVAVTINMFENA